MAIPAAIKAAIAAIIHPIGQESAVNAIPNAGKAACIPAIKGANAMNIPTLS